MYGIDIPAEGDTLSTNLVINSNDPGAAQEVVNVTVNVDPAVAIGGSAQLPTQWALDQNYPNPFNPETEIRFSIPRTADVKLTVFNILGQKVRSLVNARMEPGYYKARWDGRNNAGVKVSSGIYIYRFESAGFVKDMKMILLK